MAKPITIAITGDAKGFERTVGTVEGLVGRLQAKVGGANSAIGGMLGKLGTPAGVATAGIAAAGAGVAAFGVISVNAYEKAAKESLKLQRVMGGTIADASRFRFVAQQTGMDADTLGAAWAKFSKSAVGPAGKTLAALGISLKDASGQARPAKDVFGDLSEVIARMPNGVEKNALAMQLFGRSGTNLLPILNRGRDGISDLMAKADEFGYTIGEKGVADVKKHIRAQREMHAAWEGFKIQIGSAIMPLVGKLSEGLSWLVTHFNSLAPALRKVVLIGGGLVLGLGAIAVAVMVVNGALAFLAANPVVLIIAAIIAAIAGLVAGFVWLYNNVDGFHDFVDNVVSGFRDGIGKAIDWITTTAIPALVTGFGWVQANVFPAVADGARAVAGGFQTLAGWIVTAWDWIYDKVSAFVAWYSENVAPAVDAVNGLLIALFERVWQVVQAVWPVIATIIGTAIDGARTFITDFITIVGPIWKAFWGGVSAVVGFVWPIIQSVIEQALQVIGGVIRFVTALINADWGRAWLMVIGAVQGAWEWIKGVVAGGLQWVLGLLQGAAGAIGGALDGGWRWMAGAAANGVRSVIDFVSDVPDRVRGLFAGAGRWLIDAGRAIMDGLLSGIRDAWNKVADFVGSIAGKIKGLKGPLDYDAKLLIPAGHLIMEGLGRGLSDGWNKVAAMVSGIAPDLSATVGLALPPNAAASAAAAGGSSSAVTNHIYLQVDASGNPDPGRFADQVWDALTTKLRTTGAQLPASAIGS